MKKLFVMCAMLAAGMAATAQNIQMHYDFGRKIYSEEQAERQNVTLTFEQFKADNLGSWFWFIDLDMHHDGMKGAYTEISREFTFNAPTESTTLAAHVEFDGGVSTGKNAGWCSRFQNAALIGPAINGHNADFSTTWSIQAMYKQYFKQGGNDPYASFQLTGVWGTTFADGKGTFSGFIDFWRGEKSDGHGQLVILTEPQLWYNVNKSISVGTEVEISNNFIYNTVNDKSFFINPTLAVKFNL